jgi:hypothetical protein
MFIFLSELFRSILAKLLYRFCGDSWAKSTQFIRILVGIICITAQPSSKIAVLIGLSVFVFEAVRIRAEIGGWNKTY